jgi:hypothetical protein
MATSHELWTFVDAVVHLLDSAGASGAAQQRRKARRAVLQAYREFPLRDDWGYYHRRGQIITEPSQSGGTVAFDFTGGTHERELTLSGATWPENARYGMVKIANAAYFIEDRKSPTVVTLRIDSNPGEDLPAGTSYIYYRNVYPTPLDFRRGQELRELDQTGRPVVYTDPDHLLWLQSVNGDPQSWQDVFTVRNAGDDYDTLSFELQPPPSDASTFAFMYFSDPRSIRLHSGSEEYSTGTISVSGTTVTGVGTTFTNRMVGSVIRFTTDDTNVPTGIAGGRDSSGNDTDNPYDEFRIVTAVATAESLTIDQATDGTYSAVKYTIGDPLDLDYHVMLEAFLAMCQWKFGIVTAQEQKVLDSLESAWQREFGRARANDYRQPLNPTRYGGHRYQQLYDTGGG